MVWFFIKHKASFLREAFFILCNYNFSLSVFNPSGIRRKYIANVSFLFADVPISSGCAGGRPQSMPCACPTVGWKACPTARASGPGPEWGLRLLIGGGGGGGFRPAAAACAAGRLCGGGLFLCKEVQLGRLHGPGCRSLFGPPLRRAVE